MLKGWIYTNGYYWLLIQDPYTLKKEGKTIIYIENGVVSLMGMPDRIPCGVFLQDPRYKIGNRIRVPKNLIF